MQLVHYPNEASFNKAIAPHLAADPDANPRLLIPSFPEQPFYFSDEAKSIFLRTDEKNRWMPSGRDVGLAREMADTLSSTAISTSITGDQAVTAEFANMFIKRGAQITLDLKVNWYRLHELRKVKQPQGRWKLGEANDLDLLCTMVSAFQAEAVGINRPPEVIRPDAEKWLNQKTALFWEMNGQITALVNMIPHCDWMVRLGAVYCQPQHRGRGYIKALTAQACQMAQQRGLQVGLNADTRHPFTNQMYQNIGFVQRGATTDYHFTLA